MCSFIILNFCKNLKIIINKNILLAFLIFSVNSYCFACCDLFKKCFPCCCDGTKHDDEKGNNNQKNNISTQPQQQNNQNELNKNDENDNNNENNNNNNEDSNKEEDNKQNKKKGENGDSNEKLFIDNLRKVEFFNKEINNKTPTNRNFFKCEFTQKEKIKILLNDIKKEDRVFIQSDTEGKLFNILYGLFIAGVLTDIDQNNKIYYNDEDGTFGNKKTNMFIYKVTVNENFKGTYIHCGDIVDRCGNKGGCIMSLLYLLYVKSKLKDRIKLICGNHEIAVEHACNDSWCEKNKIMKIVKNSIINDYLKYFDTIKIGNTDFIITHKELLKQDINVLRALKDKIKDEDISNNNIEKIKHVVEIFNDYSNNISYKNDDNNSFDTISGYLEHFNKIFKWAAKSFDQELEKITEKNINIKIDKASFSIFLNYHNYTIYDNLKSDFVLADFFNHCRHYRVENEKEQFKCSIFYVHEDYKIIRCLSDHSNSFKNQICGHVHYKPEECYIKDCGILNVDNASIDCSANPFYLSNGSNNYFPKMNLHVIDKTKGIENDKVIVIINKIGENFRILDKVYEEA